MSVNVRVSKELRDFLKQIAAFKKSSMQTVLEEAIRNYEKDVFFENLNKAYEELEQKTDDFKEYKEELKTLDITLKDGLEEEKFEY